MATLLHLETTTTNCSVSLAEDGVLIGLKEHASAQYSHAEELHVFISDVLAEAGKTLDQLVAVAVSMGPGSYTGLRIGVSAAKGLCFALEIPLISISTLQALALQASEQPPFVIPLLDARRMEVYSAVYSAKNHEVREVKAEIISEESFGTYLNQGRCILIGPGARKCQEVIGHKNAQFQTDNLPSAREMVSLAWTKWEEKKFEDVAYFEPFYLKNFIPAAKKN